MYSLRLLECAQQLGSEQSCPKIKQSFFLQNCQNHVASMIRLLASHLGGTGFYSRRGRYRIIARGNRVGRRRFLGDLPFPPPFRSGAAPYSPRFTLIGSQDLDAIVMETPAGTSVASPPTQSPFLGVVQSRQCPAFDWIKHNYLAALERAANNRWSLESGDFLLFPDVSPPNAWNPARPSPSELGLIPGWVAPGFLYVGIVPDDATGRRVFSGLSRFPRPFISALLHAHLASPSSALKTPVLRANIFTHTCLAAPSWFETRSEIGSKIDTELFRYSSSELDWRSRWSSELDSNGATIRSRIEFRTTKVQPARRDVPRRGQEIDRERRRERESVCADLLAVTLRHDVLDERRLAGVDVVARFGDHGFLQRTGSSAGPLAAWSPAVGVLEGLRQHQPSRAQQHHRYRQLARHPDTHTRTHTFTPRSLEDGASCSLEQKGKDESTIVCINECRDLAEVLRADGGERF
ncbi:hypothetical protein PR048_031201 [Dryococelus australis]|uniref:Uncharacterized protein n=1 Tax=Dryococelus australis TaxID=614101 RepID=A0ABQ9G4L5_9NEOP|nr:hypothetical protein PR048_031201 [Dryococelus australis]